MTEINGHIYDVDTDANMVLWNLVSKTNPKHTKKVKFGREFTAIDPHSQIMEATKMFGPAGQGWGWEVQQIEYLETKEVAMLVSLWVGSRDQNIMQWGQAGLYIDKADTRKDGDCMKKATTDGITKCLSYLGFNADIFLGKFDDSKYVQDVTKEFVKKEEESSWTNDLQSKLDDSMKTLESSEDLYQLAASFKKVKANYALIKAASSTKADLLSSKYTELATKLKET